ncbi:hypothetical protein ACFL2H_07820 [Planctomycetota bacterium]
MARRFALVLMGVTGTSLLLRTAVHRSNPLHALPSICLAAIGFGLLGLVLGRIAEQTITEAVNGLKESDLRKVGVLDDSTQKIR